MCFIKFILYFSLCALISRNFIMVLNIDVWGFFLQSAFHTDFCGGFANGMHICLN